MSWRRRGNAWVVTVYNRKEHCNRWVGTFATEHEAAKASALAEVTRLEVAWTLEAKGEDRCRNCGAPAITLHHIVPRAACHRGEADHPPFNGMPLCQHCHIGWHRRSVRIPFTKLLPEEVAFMAGAMGIDWMEGNYPGGGRVNVNDDLAREVALLRAENCRLRDFVERQNGSVPSTISMER